MTAITRSTRKVAETCLVWCVIAMLCVNPVQAATGHQSCQCESPLSATRSMSTPTCCSGDTVENIQMMPSSACCSSASETGAVISPSTVCACQGTPGNCQCVDCHCGDQGAPAPAPAIPSPSENQTLTVSIPNPCHGLLTNREPSKVQSNPATVDGQVLSAQQMCALLSRFSC